MLAFSRAAPQPSASAADHLVSQRVEVAGRGASFGVGGHGMPVLFLHGWALGHRSYRRALRRIASKGCRVYAPDLPGFGGTAGLPAAARSIEGYGAWVGEFLDAVAVDEPVLVIGHSFGGGVATAFAHAAPQRVRHLVLLNAVGGQGWPGLHLGPLTLSQRPLWDWALQFAREVMPIGEGLDNVRHMAEDFVPNVLRNPLGLWEVGQLARRADLTNELADLRAHGVGVLVLSSELDGVIPKASFESLCAALGTEGQVVAGRHSWLLADPDAFATVLDNVVQVQLADHRIASETTTRATLARLLRATAVPDRVARRLVAQAPPLWLISEPAAVLAGDLALCHPRLGRREVRAVARPVEGSTLRRLTVVAADRPGLLADTAAVLAGEGLSVRSASAATFRAGRLAMHSLTFDGGEGHGGGDDLWDSIGARLRDVGRGVTAAPAFVPVGRAEVVVRRPLSGPAGRRAAEHNLVEVRAPDQTGLLWAVCRWLADHGCGIDAASAAIEAGWARDVFVVAGACDATELADHLSRPPSP